MVEDLLYVVAGGSAGRNNRFAVGFPAALIGGQSAFVSSDSSDPFRIIKRDSTFSWDI
jgi:hypothetical protein